MAVERPDLNADQWCYLQGDHLSRYFYAFTFVEGKSVLDAGTGPGYGAAVLKVMGKAARVQAVDIDATVIEEAKVRFGETGVRFSADDCEALATVEGPLDVICSFENIEHLKHPERFLATAARLLLAEGVLLCSTPDRAETETAYVNGRSTNHYHVNEWYRNDFRALLSEHFEDVEVLSQVRSYGYVAKQKSAEVVQEHLKYLWSNPMLRLARRINKLMGRATPWHDVTWLLAPQPSDFPIVPASMVGVLGQVHCHFAVCRKPKKTT